MVKVSQFEGQGIYARCVVAIAEVDHDLAQWRREVNRRDVQSLPPVGNEVRTPRHSKSCGRSGHPEWEHDCAVTDRVNRLYEDLS